MKQDDMDYAYSFEQMCIKLGLSSATLKSRIYRRSNLPPFQKIGRVYWFPKELYLDWFKKQEVIYEVNSAS